MEILHYLLLMSVCAVTAKNIPNAKPDTPLLSSSSHISSESSDSVASIEEVEEHESDLSSERSAVKSQYTDGIYSQEMQRINQRYNTNRFPLTPAMREMQENMLDNQLSFREQMEQDYLDYLEDSRQQQAQLLERQQHLRANMQREYLNQQEKALKETHNIDKERSKIEKKNREALKKRQSSIRKQSEAEKKQAKQMKKMKELQYKVQSKIEQLDYKNMILNHMSSPQAELARKKVQEQKTLLEAVLRFVINFVKLNEQPTVGSFDSGSSNGLSTPLYMNDEVSSDIIPFGGNRGSTGSGIGGGIGGHIGTTIVNDEFSSDIRKPGSPSPALMMNDEISSDVIPPNSAAVLGNDEISSDKKNTPMSSLYRPFYGRPNIITGNGISFDNRVKTGNSVNLGATDVTTSKSPLRLGNDKSSDDILNGITSHTLGSPAILEQIPSNIADDYSSQDKMNGVGPYANPSFRITPPSSNGGGPNILTQIPSNIADDYSSQDKMNGVGPYANPAFRVTAPSSDGISSDDILKGLGSPGGSLLERNTNSIYSTGSPWGFRDDGSLVTVSNEPIVTSIISDAITLSENSKSGNTVSPRIVNDEISSDMNNSGGKPTGIVNDEKSSDMHDALLSDIVSFDKSSSNSTDLNIDSIVNAAMSDTVTTSSINNDAALDVMTTNIDKIASIASAASNVDAATAEPTSIDASTSTTDTTGETVVPLISANINTAGTASPAESITSEATTTTKSSATANTTTPLVSDLPATDSEPITPDVETTTNTTATTGVSKAQDSTTTESVDVLTTISASEASESNTVANTNATAIVTDVITEESPLTTTDTVSRATTESGFDLTSPVDSAMLDPVLSTLINSWTASESGADLLSLGL